jgi:hypothetical protein
MNEAPNTTAMRSLSALALLISAGCSAVVVVPAPTPAITDPYAAPALPLIPPRDRAESMNTEYYLGSADEERDAFARFGREMRAIQRKQSTDNGQPIQRGFHAKQHGCLHGTLELFPGRDPRTRYGLFAGPRRSFPVWARLSNGVGWQQHDGAWDARGFAVKVMEVEGEKLVDDEARTQDFLLTNSPVPIGRNAVHFMRFAEANSRGVLPALWFALTHPQSGMPGVNRTGTVRDVISEQYWSGGAFHLGAHQAVKLTLKAVDPPTDLEVDDGDPDYLRVTLREHAAKGLRFRLYVQFQVNPEDTPIECAAVVWEEEVSPLVPVADLVFPPQDIDEPWRATFNRKLSFNPWHSLVAHQPMGHINRARRYVYDASSRYRQRGPEPEPYAPLETAEPEASEAPDEPGAASPAPQGEPTEGPKQPR